VITALEPQGIVFVVDCANPREAKSGKTRLQEEVRN
jgi:hypothetical protein